MTVTTTAQNTELAKPVTRIAYFAEFQFVGGTLRVSTLGQNYTWGGFTWIGIGSLGSIDAVEESESITSQPLSFELNIAQSSILALGIGDPAMYRGKIAKLYMCPLNEQFQLVDTPVICWRGYMDMMTVSIDASGSGKVSLKCETSAYGLNKLPTLRVNAAQQLSRYPTDTGFQYLTNLINDPQIWLSVAFQISLGH